MALKSVKSALRGTIVHRLWQQRRARKQIAEWEAAGKPSPPPHVVKQRIVRDYAKRLGLTKFVETGTFMGDMVAAQRRNFERIYSIELDPTLYQRAKERFKAEPRITILQGDSGVVLPALLQDIEGPCLFWLDGHYSAGPTARGESDTPISKELDSIMRHSCKTHVVLIDDARCFNGDNGYPKIGDLQAGVNTDRPDLDVSVQSDIIRIIPRAD